MQIVSGQSQPHLRQSLKNAQVLLHGRFSQHPAHFKRLYFQLKAEITAFAMLK